MNFELDADTEEMARSVRRFAQNKLAGTDASSGDDVSPGRGHGFSPDVFRHQWQIAAGHGLVATSVPTRYGGGGLDAVATTALIEAVGEGCPDTGFVFSMAAHQFACLLPIVDFGSEEQKQRWLPAMCSGEHIAAHAITEPESGSDALSLRTRAERGDDGSYLLNGGKCFTTNAPVADVFLVQAATRPGGGIFGLTSFIVPAGTPGLTVGAPERKAGLRGSPMAEVHFDNCVVPADQVLGSPGGGAGVFTASMNWERTCLFAAYVGAMKRLLDSTVQHVRAREQFGAPIGSFQAVSHRIVDMTLAYESARLLLYKAAAGLARGSDDTVAPALAKIAVSEAAVRIGLDAVQLRGGMGVIEGEAETLLCDALPSRIFSGSNEIQRNNIARALGLGRRPVRVP
ncbi:L-prolyl-[peptidyl-carrier protein] dehydrogenase [Streptomyces sp. CG1]|uniref:L-prolyl-[peptidyl-carrier protein] dehydrogenase n=1 Tax=Streptomyces sp. CG1 TaxID=1287523 RepID=UPI0034E2889B